jgi:hypothetical protein
MRVGSIPMTLTAEAVLIGRAEYKGAENQAMITHGVGVSQARAERGTIRYL